MCPIIKILTCVAGVVFLATSAWADTDIEKLLARAKQGDVAARLDLARMYRWGNVSAMADGSQVEKNLPEAIRQLKGIPNLYAKWELAQIYAIHDFDQHNYAAAASLFSEVARSDDPDKKLVTSAQYQLGMLLYQECPGYRIDLSCDPDKTSPYKNYKMAAHWFELAAARDDKEAKFQLASMYENGRGVPLDFEEAAKLYQAAAEAGETEAPVMLGDLYAR